MTLSTLEAKLDELLNKKAPVSIPPNGRKTLAQALWVIALIFGILQLLAAYWLWEAGHRVDSFVDYANAVSSYYGGGNVVNEALGPFFYLSLLTMAGVGALLLFAAPGLKAMKKSGWNLLFYAAIVEAVASVLLLFTRYGGFGDFLWSMICAVVGAYLLFQVRDQFNGHKAVARAADHSKVAAPKDAAKKE